MAQAGMDARQRGVGGQRDMEGFGVRARKAEGEGTGARAMTKGSGRGEKGWQGGAEEQAVRQSHEEGGVTKVAKTLTGGEAWGETDGKRG